MSFWKKIIWFSVHSNIFKTFPTSQMPHNIDVLFQNIYWFHSVFFFFFHKILTETNGTITCSASVILMNNTLFRNYQNTLEVAYHEFSFISTDITVICCHFENVVCVCVFFFYIIPWNISSVTFPYLEQRHFRIDMSVWFLELRCNQIQTIIYPSACMCSVEKIPWITLCDEMKIIEK